MEQETVTFLGLAKDSWTTVLAGVAGATGLWNFGWQWMDRRDRIHVGFGPITPSIEPYNSVYVINQSKHPVELQDYGLILENGKLMSLPWYWQENQTHQDDPNSYAKGERHMKPHEKYQAGLEHRGLVAGSWAITATQSRPTLAFSHTTPMWKRLWLIVRHFVKPSYS